MIIINVETCFIFVWKLSGFFD